MGDHCHVTEKYRGTADRDCNINVSLNYRIPIVFHNLNNCDACFIMQEIGKSNFKLNFIPNGLEKVMSLILIISYTSLVASNL